MFEARQGAETIAFKRIGKVIPSAQCSEFTAGMFQQQGETMELATITIAEAVIGLGAVTLHVRADGKKNSTRAPGRFL